MSDGLKPIGVMKPVTIDIIRRTDVQLAIDTTKLPSGKTIGKISLRELERFCEAARSIEAPGDTEVLIAADALVLTLGGTAERRKA